MHDLTRSEAIQACRDFLELPDELKCRKQYFDTAQPGAECPRCVMGHLLLKAGLPDSTAFLDRGWAEDLNGSSIGFMMGTRNNFDGGISFRHPSAPWLRIDLGLTPGELDTLQYAWDHEGPEMLKLQLDEIEGRHA